MAQKRSILENLSVLGSDNATVAIVKATDSSIAPPKHKHIQALLQYTHQDIPMRLLSDKLYERVASDDPAISIKALCVLHQLIVDGKDRFCAHLALMSYNFDIQENKSNVLLANFTHSYALFLNTKIIDYRSTGFDIGHVLARNPQDKAAVLKKGSPVELFKIMKMIQNQLDVLLTAVPTEQQKKKSTESSGLGLFGVEVALSTPLEMMHHPIVKECVKLLLQDSKRLFVAINDGSVNMLERFFTMPLHEAKEALGIHEKCIDLYGRLEQFMQLCEKSSMLNGEKVLDLKKAPASILHLLKGYVNDKSTVLTSLPTSKVVPPPRPTNPNKSTAESTGSLSNYTTSIRIAPEPPESNFAVDLMSFTKVPSARPEARPLTPPGHPAASANFIKFDEAPEQDLSNPFFGMDCEA